MLTEKGTLPIGIEYDGKIHKDFEIREELVRDAIEIFDNPEAADRAAKNNAFMGLCTIAKRIIKIGAIPREAITTEMLLDCSTADMNELHRATQRLEEKRRSFRVAD